MYKSLKELREANNVSVDKMIEILGLSTKSAYYKKEAGKVKFTLDDARKISNYFGAPIDEIFFDNKVS